MSNSGEPPCSNAMDRLSDQLGGFIPGCSHLPSRHPVKVSLVMGCLGTISGWLSVALALLIEPYLRPDLNEIVFSVIPGVVLGVLVWSPLLLWQNQSVRRCTLAVILSVDASFFHLWAAKQFIDMTAIAGYTWSGLIGGCGYSLAGLATIRPRRLWLLIVNSLSSALVHWAFAILRNNFDRLQFLTPSTVIIIQLACIASVFAWVFAGLGITFAVSFWDRASCSVLQNPTKF